MRKKVRDKIRQVAVSPMFTAILDFLLGGDPRTTPALAGVIITSDGIVLGRQVGDIGFNSVLGDESDLIRNVVGVGRVAGLTSKEQQWLLERVAELRD